MEGESINIIHKQIEKLKQLFPETISEGKIDWEKLQATLGKENIEFRNERYVLNWAGKSEAFKVLQQSTNATLKPVPGESVNFDTTENVFIEGENLEVLKVLQKSYYNKIKCIIIDPPYNTGNDSFIYPDSFKENKEDYLKRIGEIDEEGYILKEGFFRKNSKDNGHYHSNWLSMMYPRLFLARNLLTDDGVIFIFIDDNEVYNLRLVMNEIFGEENFLGSIAWKHTQQSKNDEKYFSRHYNTIIVYRRTENVESFRFERTDENNKNYSNPDNDPNGDWRSGDVRSPNYRKTLCFDITTPSGKKIAPPTNGWRWAEENLLKKIRTGEILFDKDETKIIRKIYLKCQEGRTPENLWDGEEYGTTRMANTEIKELFDNEAIFDTPKPTNVISKILELLSVSHKNERDIILDFFAGSGTTAHAVLELNKGENGNRRFVLVQLPEKCDESSEAFKAGYKTIADISKERIRRVIKKLEKEAEELKKKKVGELSLTDQPQTPDRLPQNETPPGFKVFKLSPSSFKIWRGNDITEENLITQLDAFTDPVREGSEKENMLYELILKSGYLLTDNIQVVSKYYSIKDGELIIALNEINQKLVDAIIDSKPKKVIMLDNLFIGNDQLKTNTVLQMKDAEIDFKTI